MRRQLPVFDALENLRRLALHFGRRFDAALRHVHHLGGLRRRNFFSPQYCGLIGTTITAIHDIRDLCRSGRALIFVEMTPR
ncbi:hypothetical protein [Methylocystis sp. B8]|uniref:hypothetical protein n=1 Tax=Methylocystis sp. B8 TaxID=544938 RepID=UPI0010FE56D3|nr:hypothetical protein [Methylocystis sp. B8]TLG75169.1 hypothetical protein FEV16_11715 [Methylocystis sp. B8]